MKKSYLIDLDEIALLKPNCSGIVLFLRVCLYINVVLLFFVLKQQKREREERRGRAVGKEVTRREE